MSEQQIVRCSISNCHYYAQGKLCQANEIMVMSDTMSNNLPETMDAPQAAQVKHTPVTKGTESCCKTFVPKDSFQQNLDGVYKNS